MIYLVLDSSILRQTPTRKTLAYDILSDMVGLEELSIHIPEIVLREVTTGFVDDAVAACRQLEAVLNDVHRLLPPSVLANERSAAREVVQSISERVARAVGEEFQVWLQRWGVTMEPLFAEDTPAVFDAYFSGGPPFTTPKSRKDIPDAFIHASIRRLAAKHNPLMVVTQDRALGAACESIGVTVHTSLNNFLADERVLKARERLKSRRNFLRLVFGSNGAYARTFEKEVFRQLSDYLRAHEMGAGLLVNLEGTSGPKAQGVVEFISDLHEHPEILWEYAAVDNHNRVELSFRTFGTARVRFNLPFDTWLSLRLREPYARGWRAQEDLTAGISAEQDVDVYLHGTAILTLPQSLECEMDDATLQSIAQNVTIAYAPPPSSIEAEILEH